MGDMFVWKVAGQVPCGYVPHFYCLIQTTAEQGRVVLQQADCPDEVQVSCKSL